MDDIKKCCLNCVHCKEDGLNGKVNCSTHGLVEELHICKEYKYNPYKRPPKKRTLPTYSAEDFSID